MREKKSYACMIFCQGFCIKSPNWSKSIICKVDIRDPNLKEKEMEKQLLGPKPPTSLLAGCVPSQPAR